MKLHHTPAEVTEAGHPAAGTDSEPAGSSGGAGGGGTEDDGAEAGPPCGPMDELEQSACMDAVRGEREVLEAIVQAMTDAGPGGGGAGGGRAAQAPLQPTFATNSTPMLGTNTLHEIDQASQVRCGEGLGGAGSGWRRCLVEERSGGARDTALWAEGTWGPKGTGISGAVWALPILGLRGMLVMSCG